MSMLTSLLDSSPEHKAQYLEAMAKTIPQKLRLITPWLDQAETVVDLGCADGILSQALSYEAHVVGIDMCAEAILACNRMKEDMGQDGRRLKFQHAAAEHFTLEKPADAVVCCSILHEVFSYSKEIDPFISLEKTLNNIRKNLNRHGRLIIRDFIAPELDIPVLFEHEKSDIMPGLSYTEFHSKRRTDAMYSWKFSAHDSGKDFFQYRSQKMKDVYEYIFHKDFRFNWETEIQETFAFWNGTQAKAMLKLLGYELEHYAEIDNPWITENRLVGKVRIFDGQNPLPFPKYQSIIVARKL